jgi:hypothetical protein
LDYRAAELVAMTKFLLSVRRVLGVEGTQAFALRLVGTASFVSCGIAMQLS